MRTFLVVDDSAVVRKVARRILESFDFVCEEAADGQLALEACRTKMPNAILLDWNMPNMNGLEFLNALKAEFGEDTPKVVFCTTENDMNHIVQAMDAGATEYIMKPFDSEIIEGKLRQIGLL